MTKQNSSSTNGPEEWDAYDPSVIDKVPSDWHPNQRLEPSSSPMLSEKEAKAEADRMAAYWRMEGWHPRTARAAANDMEVWLHRGWWNRRYDAISRLAHAKACRGAGL